ncbi:MAG: hypothetical protein ACI9EF_000294 [Pseudohongiellaceae bacterium]|jgi:hypothetical protein
MPTDPRSILFAALALLVLGSPVIAQTVSPTGQFSAEVSKEDAVEPVKPGMGGLVRIAGRPAAGLKLRLECSEWEDSAVTDDNGRWWSDRPFQPGLYMCAMMLPCGLQKGWHANSLSFAKLIEAEDTVRDIPAGTLVLDTGDLTVDELAAVQFVHLGLGEKGSYSVQTCSGELDPVDGRASIVFRPSTISIRPGNTSILATPQRVTLEEGATVHVTLRRASFGRVDLVWGPGAPFEPRDVSFEKVLVTKPWSDGSVEARELHRYAGEGRNGTFPSSLLGQYVLPPGQWVAWVHGPFSHWGGRDWEGPEERFGVPVNVTAGTRFELSAMYDPETGEAGATLESADR